MSEYPYEDRPEMPDAKMVKGSGALHEFDDQLERYEKVLDDVRARLGAIISVYDGPERAERDIKPEPKSQLRGRVVRLSELTGQLERILRDIDL